MVLDTLSRKTGSLCKVSFLRTHPALFLCYRISCASSKHLQTRRFLDTLQGYLYDIQRILIQLHRAANARPEPFVDHTGILRDTKTGRPIHGAAYYEDSENMDDEIQMRECSCLYACRFPTTFLVRFWLWHPMASTLLFIYFFYLFRLLPVLAHMEHVRADRTPFPDIFSVLHYPPSLRLLREFLESVLTLTPAAGYSFFDSGEIELLGRRKKKSRYSDVGEYIPRCDGIQSLNGILGKVIPLVEY